MSRSVHMSGTAPLAPGISPSDRVVLFDGVCRLCSAWARFLIRFDRKHQFKLATVQSPAGRAILEWYSFPTDVFDTMVLVEDSRLYTRSTAAIRVLARLPFPWRLLSVTWLIPVFLRNWLYDRIALNRYRLFGKHAACVVVSADHDGRFLNDEMK